MKCSFPQFMTSGKSVGGPALLYLRRSSWRIWPFSSEYVGDKKTDPILFFLHPTSCIPWIELHRDLTNAGEDTLLVWEINLSAAFRKKAPNRWSLTHEEGGFEFVARVEKLSRGGVLIPNGLSYIETELTDTVRAAQNLGNPELPLDSWSCFADS